MELKTILQILRMNEDRLAEYVLEAAPSLDLNLFDRIIRSWREHPTYIPAPSNVATALINFIIDNHDKAGFHITTTAVPVTPDNYRVIEWETEEFGRYCATFTLQDAEFINDALADIMDGEVINHMDFTPERRYVPYLRELNLYSFTAIPRNPAYIINELTSRFSGAMWFDKIQEKTIILAGVGGIGSYVGFLLSRMNPKSMFIYDDDIVEAANMSGQLYATEDIGIPKVDALSRTLNKFSMYNSVFAVKDRFTIDSEATDIMICGFDNMEARKIFFEKWRAHVLSKPTEERSHCLFIDGRLAAEELQVFCIRGDSDYHMDKYYNQYMFSDAQADATVCSYKQTTYMANMIGSIIVNLFTNFVANEIVPLIRELPFLTSYEADTMHFKTED